MLLFNGVSNMKTISALGLCSVLLAGCAATGPGLPSGVTPGRFVTLVCEGQQRFQLRFSDDGKTVRVRAHHGSAELDHKADGVFEGEGYILRSRGDAGMSLDHAGKSQGRNCQVQPS
jgi:hypothetical protein